MKRCGALLLVVAALATGLAVLGPTRPAAAVGGTPVMALSAGLFHACALRAGIAYCWGQGSFGALGDGTSTDQNVATAVNVSGALAGKAVSAIAAGSSLTCALDTLGAAYCWGNNTDGQLGDGTTTDRVTPAAVTMPTGVTFTSIATRSWNTCALSTTGAAYCWGYNGNGAIGDGTTSDSSIPVATTMSGVAGGAFSQITAGSLFACGLSTAGTVYCWGYNASGFLGDGTTTQRLVPTAVSTSGALAGKTITKLAGDYLHTCALDSDGQAYCWGIGTSGQLGDSSNSNRSAPVAVNTSGVLAGKRLVDIDPGYQHTCAIDSDGVAYCWGSGANGGLGNGGTASSNVPVVVTVGAIPAGTVFTSIGAGYRYACGQKANGRTYCWGFNPYGQLGTGSNSNTSAPANPVTSLPSVPDAPTSVSAVRSGSTATVSWTPPADNGSSAITGYTATASPGGASCATASTSCAISGLSSTTAYTFRVGAANAVGSSASGDVVVSGGAGGGLADTGTRTVSYVVVGLLALWLGIRLRRLYSR
jgi:alpha-tubulin suppressor-like RCC1 family protein